MNGARHMRASARAAVVALALLVASLALAGEAEACVCVSQPLEERLDEADAAVVARVIGVQVSRAIPEPSVVTFDVQQRVKGDVPGLLEVRSPSGTDCDLALRDDQVVGLLLMRATTGEWLANACSVVDPGRLVAEGGEPRGGPIKVAVGLVILGLVLGLSFYRLRRGSRPQLPGAPEA